MSLLSGPASLLGIGGDHGDYYKNGELQAKGTKSLAEMLDAARGAKVNTAGQGLVNGGTLADALKGMSGDEVSGLATSPIYGSNVAQQQVMSDPLLSGLFNKGGSRDKALEEESRLRDQGFQLTPEDHEAYGQASGNIARQFGQSEQSLASALANRGLAAGGSGAAGAQFSGLQGNKNEQLAKMQMQIANQRMENTKARLAENRNYTMQLNGLGQTAESNAFNRNLQGAQDRQGLAKSLGESERGDYKEVEGARQKSMESQQNAETMNLGDALSNGLYQGAEAGMGARTAGVVGGKPKDKQLKGDEAGVPGGGAGGMMSLASLLA